LIFLCRWNGDNNWPRKVFYTTKIGSSCILYVYAVYVCVHYTHHMCLSVCVKASPVHAIRKKKKGILYVKWRIDQYTTSITTKPTLRLIDTLRLVCDLLCAGRFDDSTRCLLQDTASAVINCGRLNFAWMLDKSEQGGLMVWFTLRQTCTWLVLWRKIVTIFLKLKLINTIATEGGHF
jgi:hypothetical protein